MRADRKRSPREGARVNRAALRNGTGPRWLVFGGAALAAFLLYLPTLQYGFVWDDVVLVVNNPFLARTNPVELFAKGFWNNPEVGRGGDDMSYYRPLTSLSLYVDRKVSVLRPAGYHLTSIIINAAIVFLMSLLLWELFRSVWLAGLGGLLIGIHPAMNCAVTFISNRTYLLALFFLLVGSYALLRGRRDRARAWWALFGGSLLLSTLALEASLVFAAIAGGWLLLNRSRYQRLRVWMAASALPVAVYCLLRLGIARVPFSNSAADHAIAEPLRITNAFGQQLLLLFFPFNQKVIYVPAEPFTRFSVYTIAGLLFLSLPLCALIRLGRSHGASSCLKSGYSAQSEAEAGRLGWYGYAWMVLFLLPFAHLVFLGPAGRALYLAAPGILILLAALFQAKAHKQRTTRVVYGAVLLCTAVLAVQTLRRNPVWRNELTLSEAMVREAPGSAGGHHNYGLALAGAFRREEAIEQFRMAVRIDPDFVLPHISLAFALANRGDLPGAIREQREVVRLQPESPKVRSDLAYMLMYNGQFDSAVAEYREALQLDPSSAMTLNNLGYAYLQIGDFRQAISVLKAALRLRPDFAGPRRDLAEAYRKAGMPDSAALIEGSR